MPIVFISPDPFKAVGLESFVENYHVVCSFKHPIIEYLRQNGVNVFCLEENFADIFNDNLDSFRNTGNLLQCSEVLKHLKNLEQKFDEKVKILTFKPLSKIFKIAKEYGFDLLIADSEIAREFEDKVSFYKNLANNELVNLPKHIIGLLKNMEFADIRGRLGAKFVLQFRRGFAGSSTFFIESQEEFEHLKRSNLEHEVKMSEYIDGISLTVNCCISDENTYVSQPFVQITGLEGLNNYRGGTCGVSFSAAKNLNMEMIDNLKLQVLEIGKILQNRGFKGIYGLDFVVKEDKAYIIECNARMPISVAHFSKRQEAIGVEPIIVKHCESFGAQVAKNRELRIENREFLNGASIILRNLEQDSVKIKNPLALKWHIYDYLKNKVVETDFGFGFENFPDVNQGQIRFLPVCEGEGFEVSPNIAFCDLYFVDDVLDEKFQIFPQIKALAQKSKQMILEI